MINAISLFFKNYINFHGRSTRSEYWWPTLMIALVNFILSSWQTAGLLAVESGASASAGLIPMGLFSVFSLVIFIPSLSVTIRRLHDIGKSGWWIFISAIPCIGMIVYLVFVCTDSQPGENQWGPNPKGNYYQSY